MNDKKNIQKFFYILIFSFLLIICIISNSSLLLLQSNSGEKNQKYIPNKHLYIPEPLETRVLGNNRWLSGTLASLRIITFDHIKKTPLKDSEITANLTGGKIKTPIELFKAFTNERGTLDINFKIPSLETGYYQLAVLAKTSVGTDEITQQIKIEKEAQILLTTDKPLYQPNQIIHIRALALMKPSLRPVSNYPIILEVEDPKGNKIFKMRKKTSRFGIASADFQLADEINLGRYIVRAILEDEKKNQLNKIERKVDVQHYVLPKFKIQIKTNKKFYLPGEMLKGEIQADYFFGKPVSEADVIIKLATFDYSWNEFANIQGKTDENGYFKFENELPKYFAGTPLEKGNALIRIDASITDKAEHLESSVSILPVAKSPINIIAIPESIQFAPKLYNIFYIITSYPDGRPAKTNYTFTYANKKYYGSTDNLGISEIRMKPENNYLDFIIEAKDNEGNKAEVRISLTSPLEDEAIILRTDKAILKVGETLKLDIISSKPTGTVFIDIIHERQTYLTQSIDLKNGKASDKITIDQNLAGTNYINAYLISSTGQIIRDTRIIYVNPANDLKISIQADKDSYLPGKEAKINFTVSDLKGHPVLAALGITIVDESVFAIEEMHPGLEKIYFTLEKELLKPRYEIHGFELSQIIPEAPQSEDYLKLNQEKQKAAKVLFAAASPKIETPININTYSQRVAKVKQAWKDYVQKSAERIKKALQNYYNRFNSYPEPDKAIEELIKKKFIMPIDGKDPLGKHYKISPYYSNDLKYGFVLWSAGIDGKFNTDDDVAAYSYAYRQVFDEKEMQKDVAVVAAQPMIDTKERKELARTDIKTEGEAVRIRQFFPETLFVNPQLLTDRKGKASLRLTLADSITTWRSSILASSTLGQLGSSTFPIRVFQDFFIDIDLPISLTQNDEVSIPVAIYNYLPKAQSIRLKLEKEDWFESLSETETTFQMKQGDVSVKYFRIKVKQFGNKKITVYAYGEKMNDAVRRSIEILPDGREVWETINDRLEGDVKKIINIPENAIKGASNILVKIYPGAFNQLIEGLDKLLRMPFGCFEQTSSVTYPNVLVTGYMKKTGKINPEIQMKATQYINLGYQRLLTFEVPGGGFSWFGDPPAHKILTSYGLMEFYDMSKVYEIDPAVIKRTQDWLISKQLPDGHWDQDKGGIAEGIINRQTDILRTTAYISWALVETEFRGAVIDKAIDYIVSKINEVDDPYALAVLANAMVGWNKNHRYTLEVLDRLVHMAKEEKNVAYWQTKAPTSFGGKENTGDLETTALAAYALLKAEKNILLASKALTYLIQHKDAFGTWKSTQATVWSLKAFLAALEKSTSETDAKVSILINDKQAASFRITPENSDVLQQVDLKQFVEDKENTVEINFAGKGTALYQISTKYYLPWQEKLEKPEPLTIDVQYDRKELEVNDLLKCTVKVMNNQNISARMVIVDLGIPPGFEVKTEDIAKLVNEKIIEKFSLTGRQIIIYIDRVDPHKPIEFSYHLLAKYPIRAKSGASIAYEYYSPDISGISRPEELVIK